MARRPASEGVSAMLTRGIRFVARCDCGERYFLCSVVAAHTIEADCFVAAAIAAAYRDGWVERGEESWYCPRCGPATTEPQTSQK